ncbi:MAG: glycosyltransferase family 4 protein [Roseibium sp.]|nr:glycosyltransferase family 4 protein [Roseibium sp.]
MTVFRVLMAHNRYKAPGGEDNSTHEEVGLLRSAGHSVDLWEVSNDQIPESGSIATALNAIWSASATRELRRRLNAQRYDLLHVQNAFPLLSPAILFDAARQGIATVQHLRNYRHLCVNAGFFRAGAICKSCAKAVWPWRGIVHKCYRGSRLASVVPATTVALHKALGTYTNRVDAFIAISDHVRAAHIDGGFPADRIHKRYSAFAPGRQVPFTKRRREIFCAARFVPEKGVDRLIRAWRCRPRNARLTVAGSGPMQTQLRQLADGDPSIEFAGQLSSEESLDRMANAMAVVNCSVWEEPFGRTPVEAFSCGVPAIVSNAGGLAESVAHGRNGLIVKPGDEQQLDDALTRILTEDGLAAALGDEALRTHREKFHPKTILAQTEQIYARALARQRGRSNSQMELVKCPDSVS